MVLELKHLNNLHKREKLRLCKSLIPRVAMRLIQYIRYRQSFPTCFVSSNSKVHRDAQIGSNCLIQESFIGENVEIGDFTTIGHNGRLGGSGTINIGKFCSIAPECFMWSENHNDEYKTNYPLEHMLEGSNKNWEEYKSEPISIGNSVWIGQRTTILAGAHISDGCIVAAGAIVPRGEYPPYSVIGGVPAKVIKQRFSDKKIKALLKKKWWEEASENIFSTLMQELH